MKKDQQKIVLSLLIPCLLVVIMGLVLAYKELGQVSLIQWGIKPRTVSGLLGIVTAPFVHGDSQHLFANATALIPLMAAVLYMYESISMRVTFWLYLLTGFWVWAFARNSYHIGASGLVYAFAFFLFFSGVFRKNQNALRIALLIAMFYGGMVWGVLPEKPEVSWESHLIGAIAGVFIAYALRKQGPPPDKPYDWGTESQEEGNEAWNFRNIPPPEGFSYKEEEKPTH